MKILGAIWAVVAVLTVSASDYDYRAVIKVLTNPVHGSTVTINSSVRTFVTNQTAVDEIIIGADTNETALNYYTHVQTNGYASTGSSYSVNRVDIIPILINQTIAGSISTGWGSITIETNLLTQQGLQLPLASEPVNTRYTLGYYLVEAFTYATNSFPASSTALANFVDNSENQTVGGNKTFSGTTTIADAAIQDGSLTNVTARRIELNSTNDVIIFNNFYRLTMDDSGIPTIYEDSSGANGDYANYTPTDGSLITGVVGDYRYFRKNAANTISGTNSFTGPNSFTAASGAFDGTVVSAEDLTVEDLIVTDAHVLSNAAPILTIVETDADTDELEWRIHAIDGVLYISAYNEAGDTATQVFTVSRTGAVIDDVVFNSGLVNIDALRVATTHWVESQGNFAGILGIGTTNATPPASMSAGLVITNGTPPSADPANAIALFSESGIAKMRQPGDGLNWRLKNLGATTVGSGSDYPLTGTYAQVTYGSGGNTMTLPAAGTYSVIVTVTIDADASNGDDSILVKLYNATDAADVSNTEQNVSNIPAAKRGQAVIVTTITVTASKTIHLYARNATSARGTIDSEQTRMTYQLLY